MVRAGGIDLGGTKIEAKLFSDSWADLDSRRIDTPKHSYSNLLDAMEDQVRWLDEKSNQAAIPIGIGVPGLVDPLNGMAIIANLSAHGENLRDDLSRRVGRRIWFENDCRALTLSEARLGVGVGYKTVMGLILGTGVAVAFAIRGALAGDERGLSEEFGHHPIPNSMVRKYQLPVFDCGCGRTGCYETLVAGPGLVRLAKAMTSRNCSPKEIANLSRSGDSAFVQVMDTWAELVASLISEASEVKSPDCVVLGGGLSNIPGIEKKLMDNHSDPSCCDIRLPIFVAQGGDSSGARGAALYAADNEIRLENA